MPGVTWTERPVTEVTYFEGQLNTGTISQGFALFGMPIPVDGGLVWSDPTASYTERTVPSTTFTEKTVAATTYVERTL